jgi:hypothetical protein
MQLDECDFSDAFCTFVLEEGVLNQSPKKTHLRSHERGNALVQGPDFVSKLQENWEHDTTRLVFVTKDLGSTIGVTSALLRAGTAKARPPKSSSQFKEVGKLAIA